MKTTKYTSDGYLVVSELDSCPLWEKDSVPCCANCEHDCFYCAYAEFREDEFIESVKTNVSQLNDDKLGVFNNETKMEINIVDDKSVSDLFVYNKGE